MSIARTRDDGCVGTKAVALLSAASLHRAAEQSGGRETNFDAACPEPRSARRGQSGGIVEGGDAEINVLDVDRQSAVHCDIISCPHHAQLTASRGRRDVVPPHGGLVHSASVSRRMSCVCITTWTTCNYCEHTVL
jgi:hypothetical protein